MSRETFAEIGFDLANVAGGGLTRQPSRGRGPVHGSEVLHAARPAEVDGVDTVGTGAHRRVQRGQFRSQIRRPRLDLGCRDRDLLCNQRSVGPVWSQTS